jgi:hypothetical protein
MEWSIANSKRSTDKIIVPDLSLPPRDDAMTP